MAEKVPVSPSSPAPHVRQSSARASATDDTTDFAPGDPENPRNWPRWKKWLLLVAVTCVDLCVSFSISGFASTSKSFATDLNVSSEIGTLGWSIFVLGLALGPMALAPLSEYFGRVPVYIISWGIYLLLLLGSTLAQNIGGFLVLRALSGLFSAVTIANIGGTIADLWPPRETGLPMGLFLWAATGGSPLGYFLLSFVAAARPWRDVMWAIFGISAGCGLLMAAVLLRLGETRHSTLLRRRAAREHPATGHPHVEKRSGRELFDVALTRPFRFLFSEGIIVFGALYNGYLYGLSFLFNRVFALIFGPSGHAFPPLSIGLTFLALVLGISLGPLTNLWQERSYQRAAPLAGGTPAPEAHVSLAKAACITLPLSLFWFAWSTFASVPFIVPLLAAALWGWSFYVLILMTYLYTEDAYKQFSASALAALGLVRNLAGAGFPLFADAMFSRLGVQWASSLLAFLALLMVPIPFVLGRWGEGLRRRSPWARGHVEEGGGAEG
ncbi:hypothetical protein MMC13_003691 [Lambiella insularis]|nr:hypothetical protein [Lambiella insularis]